MEGRKSKIYMGEIFKNHYLRIKICFIFTYTNFIHALQNQNQ